MERALHKAVDPAAAKLQVVQQDDGAGYLEGYASTFGNVDEQGEAVVKGAFAKTIRERLKKGVIKLVDSHNVSSGSRAVIGIVEEAKEDDAGLWIKARFSSAPSAQEVRTKIRERILDSLSIGYRVIKDEIKDGVRLLKEIQLFEVSVVAWPANPKAVIGAVKGVIPVSSDFGLAPMDTPWNGSRARQSLQRWVGGDPSEWGPEDWRRYSRGFLWVDSEDPEKLASYYFPVASVIGGEPKYVFRGVVAALAALRGGRGAGSGPWQSDADAIERQIRRLYERFDQPFPQKGADERYIITPDGEPLPAEGDGRQAASLALAMEARARRILVEIS